MILSYIGRRIAKMDSSLLEFYVLATSKVKSGRAPPCDSAHSWLLYSAAPLWDQGCQHSDLISP